MPKDPKKLFETLEEKFKVLLFEPADDITLRRAKLICDQHLRQYGYNPDVYDFKFEYSDLGNIPAINIIPVSEKAKELWQLR